MSTELAMGSERSIALQASIQKELSVKGYSAEDDTVMAEYITIMLINDKTPEQVTAELTELIGGEYEPSFTEWLFTEKKNPELDGTSTDSANPTGPPTQLDPPAHRDVPPHITDRNANPGDAKHHGLPNRSQTRPLHQQAISSLTSQPTSSTAQKRTASQRTPSPTPGGPSAKRRQAELPDRPRAMRDEPITGNAPGPRNNRTSLLDRVGPRTNTNANGTDHIQERIRSITLQQQPGNIPHPQMLQGGFPPGMDPATMAMMQQQGFNPAMMGAGFPGGLEATMMAIQQFGQLALQMGLVPGAMGMGGPNLMANPQGFPGPGRGGHNGVPNDRGRRGGPAPGHGAPGRGTPNGGISNGPLSSSPTPSGQPVASNPPILAPTPIHNPTPANLNAPLRPLSPTLCKFVTNCTNPICRYSHPSPVATMESGVVLSTEPCEKGIDCIDKDCLKAHISKAAKNPSKAHAVSVTHAPTAPAPALLVSQIPCKFDPHCTRPNCPYYHPAAKYKSKPQHQHPSSSTMCRFGTACTRVDCTFNHPPGRVLPGQFSKGLNATAPSFTPKATEKETWNKSVDFRGKAVAPVAQKETPLEPKEGGTQTPASAVTKPPAEAVTPAVEHNPVDAVTAA